MTKYTLLSLLGFDHSKHRIRTEVLAGVTTFLTMSYILAVNPLILGDAGMDKAAVFSATVIAAAVATLVMAFYAKMPFALASGMGLNAFFAYTLVAVMGYTWQEALAAVLFEGVIFILLTIFKVREAIVNAIPLNLRYSISVGIGLFIAYIGLKNGGVIVASDSTITSDSARGRVSAGIYSHPFFCSACITISSTFCSLKPLDIVYPPGTETLSYSLSCSC